MNHPIGTLHSFIADERGTRAVIDVDNSPVCPRCAAGKGCGAGLFTGTAKSRRVEVAVRPDLSLAKGDRVELVLATDRLLRATLITYGLPLLGALLAVAVAYLLELGDLAAAMAASAGISAGWIAGRRLLDRGSCLHQFVPTIGRRLQSQGGGS
jgi:sigma-E factor negative regulatory protein RseC